MPAIHWTRLAFRVTVIVILPAIAGFLHAQEHPFRKPKFTPPPPRAELVPVTPATKATYGNASPVIESVTPPPPVLVATSNPVATNVPPCPPQLGPGEIDLLTAKAFFDRGTHLFIDARAPEDFAAGRIPAALNLPYERLEEKIGTVMLDVPSNARIVTYCSSSDCDLAVRLAGELRDFGYTYVLIYPGGMKEWKAAAFPVEGAKK